MSWLRRVKEGFKHSKKSAYFQFDLSVESLHGIIDQQTVGGVSRKKASSHTKDIEPVYSLVWSAGAKIATTKECKKVLEPSKIPASSATKSPREKPVYKVLWEERLSLVSGLNRSKAPSSPDGSSSEMSPLTSKPSKISVIERVGKKKKVIGVFDIDLAEYATINPDPVSVELYVTSKSDVLDKENATVKLEISSRFVKGVNNMTSDLDTMSSVTMDVSEEEEEEEEEEGEEKEEDAKASSADLVKQHKPRIMSPTRSDPKRRPEGAFKLSTRLSSKFVADLPQQLAQMKEIEAEKQVLSSFNRELSRQVQELQKEIANRDTRLARSKMDNEFLAHELERTSLEVASLAKQQSEAKSHLEQSSNMRATVEEAKVELAVREDRISQLEKRNRDLQKQLGFVSLDKKQILDKVSSEMEHKNRDLEDQLSLSSALQSGLTEKLRSLQDQHENEVAEYKQTFSALEMQISNTKSSLESSELLNAQLSSELHATKQQLEAAEKASASKDERMQAAAAVAEKQRQSLQQELDFMKAARLEDVQVHLSALEHESSEKEMYRNECDRLAKQVDELELKIADAQRTHASQMDAKVKEKTELEEKMLEQSQQYEKHSRRLAEEVENLATQLGSEKQRHDVAIGEKDRLQEKVDELQSQIKKLSVSKEEGMRAVHKSWEEEKTKLVEEILQTKKIVSELEKECSDRDARIRADGAQKLDLTATIDQLNSKIKGFDDKVVEWNKERSVLQRDKKSLEEEVKSSRDRMYEASNRHDENLAQAFAERDRWRSEHETMMESLHDALVERDEATLQLNVYSKALQDKQRELGKTTTKAKKEWDDLSSTLENERKEMGHEIAQLREKLVTTIKAHERTVFELTSENSDLKTDSSALRDQVRELKAETSGKGLQLKNEVDEKERANKKLEVDLARVKQEKERLGSSVDEMKLSVRRLESQLWEQKDELLREVEKHRREAERSNQALAQQQRQPGDVSSTELEERLAQSTKAFEEKLSTAKEVQDKQQLEIMRLLQAQEELASEKEAVQQELESLKIVNDEAIRLMMEEKNSLEANLTEFRRADTAASFETAQISQKLTAAQAALDREVSEKEAMKVSMTQSLELQKRILSSCEEQLALEKKDKEAALDELRRVRSETEAVVDGRELAERNQQLAQAKVDLASMEFEMISIIQERKKLKQQFFKLRDVHFESARQLTQMEVRLVRSEDLLSQTDDEIEGLNTLKNMLSDQLQKTQVRLDRTEKALEETETEMQGLATANRILTSQLAERQQ